MPNIDRMPRWHTYEPGFPDETERRREMEISIESWWKAFAGKTSDLSLLFQNKADWDLPGWMHTHLNAIDRRLLWEFGPGIPSGHRLVITPETDHHLRPLVDQILAAAPKLPGWSFHPWRLAEDLTMCLQTVEARTRQPFAATGCRIKPSGRNQIEIVFTFPAKILKADAALARNQAFVASETLFGEEALDHWIGVVDAELLADDDTPLASVPDRFAKVKAAMLATLPKGTCEERAETSEWTGWELKPKEADDYPRQIDLFVANSMYPEMWTAAHSKGNFHSPRFAESETFCYLKLDGKEGIADKGFADKAEIMDAINAALTPTKLGYSIGGGTGLRYSYIDLALTDWRAAVPVLRDLLRKGRVPKRSWLLFFDTEWANEWVGIYPDTPAPPG